MLSIETKHALLMNKPELGLIPQSTVEPVFSPLRDYVRVMVQQLSAKYFYFLNSGYLLQVHSCPSG